MSDAILVAEEWISEHYLTTEAKKESFTARVLARRKEWDAGKDAGTPRTRFVAARQELLSTFAALSHDTEVDSSAELNGQLADILGFGDVGYAITRQGPVRFVRSAGLDDPVLALIDARPTATVEELLAKDARHLAAPFARRREDRDHLGRPSALGALRRRRVPAGVRAGARGIAGCSSPSGSAGPRVATSRSTCSWSCERNDDTHGPARSTAP